MSVITPNTDFVLLKSKIELDNRNQLTFSNATNQYNYFNSLPKLVADNFTYQRQDETVRFPANRDDIIEYNYCMYRNSSYGNKWFYAYITDMKYINNDVTAISIKTDVYQTWCFELTFKSSFVEREHVNSDKYGEHTIPEGLETGEYITAYSTTFGDIATSHIVMGTTISPIDGTTGVSGGVYGGIYSGVKYYVFQSNGDLSNALKRISDNGNGDSIVSLFYCPDWITGYSGLSFSSGVAEVGNTSSVSRSLSMLIPLRPNTIDGYTPVNRKCFTYPYVSYLVSNNSGSNMEYHLEDFYDPDTNAEHSAELQVIGCCTPGCSIRLIPKYYKMKNITLNEDYNNEYGLNLGKFPVVSWGNDAYTNWLTQNGVNIAGVKLNSVEAGMLGAGISLAGGIAMISSGNPVGANLIGSGITGVFNTMQEAYKHTFNPIEARGNTNSGDVTYSFEKLNFTNYFMTVKNEYITVIDKYFSMYGYKVNSLKIPNITGRTNWNYVKTIGANIEGYIPQKDLQEIKDMLNSGITFWHNPNTFLDYSQANSIV